MVDFGGGGGAGLQWLAWIQLLVMLLLIVLLYCFSLYALQICDADVRVSVSSCVASEGAADDENLSVDRETATGFLQSPLKVVGSSSIRGEISTAGVNRRTVRSQNGMDGDAALVKDINCNRATTETHHHHPCSIFKFAREAFLKCLGLDCMAEDSISRKQGKTD